MSTLIKKQNVTSNQEDPVQRPNHYLPKGIHYYNFQQHRLLLPVQQYDVHIVVHITHLCCVYT